MTESIPTDVLTATGQARNWIYATWVCNGYNPCDHVFWCLTKSAPPSDRAWTLCAPWIVEKLGATVPIPRSILD